MLRSFGFELVKYRGWLDRLAILKGVPNSQNKVRLTVQGWRRGGNWGSNTKVSLVYVRTGFVRLRKCSFIAILKVVGLGVNFCSDSSFQTLGREKNDIFFTCSVLA